MADDRIIAHRGEPIKKGEPFQMTQSLGIMYDRDDWGEESYFYILQPITREEALRLIEEQESTE
ncbi:MAG TPA: hypothetical protein VFI02_13125 [Armatimonadota bacterium]|nr:hypothetical protein [Armatimonadota bacterium]